MRRVRLLPLLLVSAGLTLGLAGCASGTAAGGAQQLRNTAAEQLAAARQATLAPLAERLDQLARQRQAAIRAGQPASADVQGEIAAYESLAGSIRAAGSASAVRTLVAGSGLDLGRDLPVQAG